MALADILKRIDRDAEDEANDVLLTAEREAQRLHAEAEATVVADHEREVAHAQAVAQDDARTRIAGARLRGRDRVLGEKRVLIDRVLHRSVESIEKLADDRYATLHAREVARATRGGERILVAEADGPRLNATLPAALAAVGVDAELSGTTGDIAHGVLLQGERMRMEISPAAMVDARRAELEALVSKHLFGGDV
ncbi:MAG: hypothetical protein Q8K99_06535 [Actinomycetota bacterium]|nr:hypothetical protein [Actinomycetota bacterium]